MSEYGVNFIKYPIENIEGHKVQAIAKLYYGWLQGYKIIIDGKKFPQKIGHHYTELNTDQAIKDGLKEYKELSEKRQNLADKKSSAKVCK